MSDGGEDDRRNSDINAPKRAGPDEFGRAVSKIAVAQICESVGFEGFQDSALQALSNIAVRYLCDVGKTANFCANLAGRTQCNVFDVIRGLEDLGSSEGFSGASGVDQCIVSSGTVREIVEYVNSAKEIPFAQPVPRFPVVRNCKATPSFVQMGETPVGKHIPPWLPAFPDSHTYIQTPMWNERATDPRADKLEQARQRRKAERSLLSLQQRLVCNGSASASTSVERCDDAEASRAAEGNPYLASPLQFGEKDVSTVVLPAKLLDDLVVDNHVSVLETFAPAIEAVKNSFVDSGESEKNVVPEKRSAVHFKLRTGKKILGESVDLRLKNKSVGKVVSLIGRDEERDDKKRRAEYILRQSMENPQELTQL